MGQRCRKVFDDIFKPDSEPTSEQIWTASTVVAILGFIVHRNVPGHSHAVGDLFGEGTSTFANYTQAGNATFKLNATAGSLISLVVVNLLILIFTLGIGRPFIQQRLIRYMCDRMEVIGTIDVDRIAQSQAALDKLEKASPMRLISVLSDGD